MKVFCVPLVIAASFGWYGYQFYDVFYSKVFPASHAIMALVIGCSVVIMLFGIMSTNLMGMQSLLTNAVFAVILSHTELARRFKELMPQSGFYNGMRLIKEKPEGETTEKSSTELFTKAFLLLCHQKRMTSEYSKMVLLLSSFYLACITLLIYATLSVLISAGDLTTVKTSSAVTHGLLFLFYLFSFFALCNTGQVLLDRQRETAGGIQRAYFRYKGEWSPEFVDYAEFVREKYEEAVGLSPYAFFTLDRSGFLNTMALVFTYLIVLLQFKVAE